MSNFSRRKSVKVFATNCQGQTTYARLGNSKIFVAKVSHYRSGRVNVCLVASVAFASNWSFKVGVFNYRGD